MDYFCLCFWHPLFLSIANVFSDKIFKKKIFLVQQLKLLTLSTYNYQFLEKEITVNFTPKTTAWPPLDLKMFHQALEMFRESKADRTAHIIRSLILRLHHNSLIKTAIAFAGFLSLAFHTMGKILQYILILK